MLGLMAAGCAQERSPLATTAAGGATVAFESIDGPPPAVFNRLVETLSGEALARRIAIVSREGPASYRIRGYLAAHLDPAHRGRVNVGYVWDVYDGDKRRALRIAGEEAGSARPAEAWQAMDEAMIRRVARASMDRLAAFLGGASPEREPDAAAGAAVATTLSTPQASALQALALQGLAPQGLAPQP